MTAPTCIVLGGHGFIGSAIVHEARARGYTVHPAGRREYDALKGSACDLLINANGNSKKYLSREDPVLDFQLSVESVLRSLQDFQAARYVHFSTIDVYPDVSDPAHNAESALIEVQRLSPYGLHKYLAEQLVRYHRRDALILRLGGFVGAGLWKNPIFDLITGQTLRVHPDSAYPYMHTADLARIVFDLTESAPEALTLNVAGRGVMTLRDVAQMIPDCMLPENVDALKREHYEINVEQLTGRMPVPETRATVWRFLTDVMDGHTHIGKRRGDA